eukprot:403361539
MTHYLRGRGVYDWIRVYNFLYMINVMQSITEKLLFSMNVPQEIATKYNFLKQQTFESLGLQFQPGVITYVAPQNSHNTLQSDKTESTATAAYSKPLAHQKDQNQSPHAHHFHYTQLPRDFLHRFDLLKQDFDQNLSKLIGHFNQQKDDILQQNERKLDLLKQENGRMKIEMDKNKGLKGREECMCKFYEENISQLRDEHNKYVTKLKQKYENEIYEIRTNLKNSGQSLDQFRNQIFTDMKTRIFNFVQEKNQNYINAYCQDQGGISQMQIDPVELLFYIVQKMEGDNNWLVDKLAESEDEKRRLMEKSQIDMMEEDILNGQIFADLIQQTKLSDEILENFAFHHDEFVASLETTSSSNQMPLQQRHDQQHNLLGKENTGNQQQKRHNFPTAANLRESLQSNSSNNNHNSHNLQNTHQRESSLTSSLGNNTNNMLSKSQLGQNLSLKHHNLLSKTAQNMNGNQMQNERQTLGQTQSTLNNRAVMDDESAILGGTLNAMMLRDQENFNSNMSYKQVNMNQQSNQQQFNQNMYSSIESNQSHRVMLGESQASEYYQ